MRRAEDAYEDLVIAYNEAEEKDRFIDLYGFSRGASQTRHLINILKERGIPNRDGKIIGYREIVRFKDYSSSDEEVVYEKKPIYENFKNLKIRFVGLFDTVASMGVPGNDIDLGYDLTIPRDGFVENVYHARARHEYRGLFPFQSIKRYEGEILPPNFVEKYFPGAHSDVGYGYAPDDDGKSNELGKLSLNWMWYHSKRVGVALRPLTAEDQHLPEIDGLAEEELNKMFIHDSRYFYEKISDRKKRDTFYPQKPSKTVSRITIENESGLHR